MGHESHLLKAQQTDPRSPIWPQAWACPGQGPHPAGCPGCLWLGGASLPGGSSTGGDRTDRQREKARRTEGRQEAKRRQAGPGWGARWRSRSWGGGEARAPGPGARVGEGQHRARREPGGGGAADRLGAGVSRAQRPGPPPTDSLEQRKDLLLDGCSPGQAQQWAARAQEGREGLLHAQGQEGRP